MFQTEKGQGRRGQSERRDREGSQQSSAPHSLSSVTKGKPVQAKGDFVYHPQGPSPSELCNETAKILGEEIEALTSVGRRR